MSTMKTNAIATPADLYPRASLPTEKQVEHLRGQVDAAPPIVVATLDLTRDDALIELDKAVVLVDGAHRLLAAQLDGLERVKVENLGPMTKQAILEEAIRRNASHGKQLSMADKRKLAKAMVAQGQKPKGIRELLAVGERTLTRWVEDEKKELSIKQWAQAEKLIKSGASVTAAAKEVGVPRSTLQGWQKNPPKKADRPDPAPKQESFDPSDVDTSEAVATVGANRVDAIVESIIEFAKDAAKQAMADAKDGGSYPHWTELTEAAIERIRAAYPRGHKVKS